VKETDIPLARITMKDRRFSFSRGGSTEDLESSIRERGLIDPPDLLLERGWYIPIRGRRRLSALRRLGHDLTVARVHRPEEIAPFDAWALNFHDTRSRRTLNPAESCTALLQLTALGREDSEIVGVYLPLLGLPPIRETIPRCLAVAALPEPVLDALADGTITLSTATFISSLTASDGRSAFRFLLRHPLTVSQQREWCRLAPDIAARDGSTLAALFASVARAASGKAGAPGSSALHVLRERRYPALAEKRRSFAALRRKLGLPAWFHVDTHPFFERPELNVRFSANSSKDLDTALDLLKRVEEDPELRAFLSPGKEARKRR